MLHANDYAGQQKASMALHKLGNRQYTLWAIACLYMAVKSGTASKTESFIFPQLATRLLEGTKPLKNAQEGYLQALILQLRGQKKELAEFLTSSEVKEWDFLDLNVLIPQALEDVENWEGLKNHCEDYIVEKNRDDWNHWKALIKAHEKLKTLDKAVEFAKKYKKSRNSGLALVELAKIGAKTAPTLNEAAENYFKDFATKRSTYSDLVKYVSLEQFQASNWLEFLGKHDDMDLNVKVNIESFRFLLRASSYSLETLIAEQVQNYEATKEALAVKDLKDYHPGDDYLLISAYAILENSQDRISLQKAAILLELAAKHDKHQFYVRLWLVRIYLLLGAYNTAKGHYKILKVSKIQQESLSHHFLTRLSSVYPDFEVLYDAFEIYETTNGDLASYLSNTYEEGSYTQLESMNNLQRILKSSISRGIIQTEIGITKRYQSVSKLGTLTDLTIEGIADSRDFDIMWDIPRPNEAKLSEKLSLGPKVGSEWVRISQLRSNIVKNLIKGNSTLEELVKELQTVKSEELTEAEQWSASVITALGQSALDKTNSKGYTSILEKLNDANRLLESFPVTSSIWSYLHVRFTITHTILIVNGYLELLNKSKSHLPFNQSSAASLRKALEGGLLTNVKDDLLAAKNSRSTRVQEDLDLIVPWSESLGFTGVFANEVAHIVEDVVEGSAIELDKSLTYLRAVKL